MNINNGGLGFSLDLNNEDFNRRLRQSMQNVNSFSSSSVQEINKIDLSVKNLAAGVGIAFGVNEAKNFIQQMVKVRGEFEQLEIAFTTMLGSKERADKLMMEIVDFAAKTPFGLQSTSEATKMLLAYGESADTALDTMRKLGDIASGVGIPLKDIAYLYGTTMTQGRLYTQDLNQFLGRGIPMLDELAKIFGVNKNEVKGLVEAGKVGFPEVQKAIENLTASGSMFGGLMEAQSKSIAGQIEQLKDAFDVMLNDLGKEAQPIVADLINGASSVVENYKEIGSVITSLIATYGAYKTAVVVMSAANTSFLSSMDKIEKYGDSGTKRLIVSYNQAKATLENAKAQEKLAVTQLSSIRSTKQLADEANKKAIAELNSAHALKKAADEEVLSAQKKYDAYKGSHFVKKENQALTELEIAKEKQLVAAKNVSTASTNVNTTSEKVNTANKNLAVAATERQTAKKAVAAAATNLETTATNRLTFAQRINVAWTELATLATNAWNASLLSNPIVLVVAAIAGLTTAYFLLRDTTTEAEKAQERFNKTQDKVKTAVENTKKKAEEYISVLKDETATVYQQIKAYEALQTLRLKGLKDLSQEQIQKMDLTEINKLLNQSMDSTSLTAQRNELKNIERTIADINNQMNKYDKSTAGGSYAIQKLQKQLDVLNIQYDTQLSLINKISEEQKISNMTLDQKRAYWENIISATEKQINTINQTNSKQSETKTILGVNLDLVNQTGVAFQMWNVNPLISQLEQAKNELLKINTTASSEIKVSKNKSFWEQQKKEASDARDVLAYTQKGSKEWNDLTNKINEANIALQAYNDSYHKPKAAKVKKLKKSDDPLEIFKKEISTYKDQYERLTNYLDTKDKELNIAGEVLKITLKTKGETYLEFLQKQAEQLRKSASSSELARKQLIVINDEIYSLLNQSQTEDFKKQIEKDLQSAQSLIERIDLIKKAKEELTGKTDQISINKLKFIDEKDLQNQFDVETYLKDETKKFDEQYQYLKVMREAYDADMLLLQDRYNKASNDAEKQRIQDLMIIRSDEYATETKGKFNDASVNQILNEYKTLAQKRTELEEKSNAEIAKLRSQMSAETSADDLELLTNAISEIERKKKESLKNLDDEILKSSEKWVAIFADYSNKSVAEINQIVKDIESVLSNPPANLTVTEVKNLQDRLVELKKVLNKDDPFNQLGDSVKRLAENFRLANGDINFEGINAVIANTKNALNEAISMAEGLGIGVSDSAKDAIQLGTELFSAGANIAQGIVSENPLQVVKGIVGGITSIINAGDRKKERQIRKYKEAVDELTRAFNQLQIAADKALGGDSYSTQQQMIESLRKQQEEYRKMINAEKGKKKTDNGKIKEWEQAIIDAGNRINEIMENITQDILQTNAKDLANTLGDALVEAFSKGEDAAKSFEKVANDVLKNAVLNQLKKRFLETKLQGALDSLEQQMGATGLGWNGLTAAQQQQFKDKIKDISAGFTDALGAYSDLFKDLEGATDENSLSGAIKGVSEETASLIAGQMNAIRIMQAESLDIHRNSNAVLVQQLDQLFRIEYNTRTITPMLERIYNSLNSDSARAWGL